MPTTRVSSGPVVFNRQSIKATFLGALLAGFSQQHLCCPAERQEEPDRIPLLGTPHRLLVPCMPLGSRSAGKWCSQRAGPAQTRPARGLRVNRGCVFSD